MTLLSVGFLGQAAYGAALRRVFEEVNNLRREIPSLYGYLRRAESEGLVLSFGDVEGRYRVKRYALTAKGRQFITDRMAHLTAAGHLSKEVLGEAGVKPIRKKA
jgi:DNA-binding PadR family transcriptional regulator